MKDSLGAGSSGARLPPPATVLPRISRIAITGAGKRGKSMTDQQPPLTFTFGAILRMAVIVSLLWIIGDTLDGGSESFIGVHCSWQLGYASLWLLIAGSASMSIRISRPYLR
jgi:hypothetical protein